MKNNLKFPGLTIGTEFYDKIEKITQNFGKRAIIIANEEAMNTIGEKLLSIQYNNDIKIKNYIINDNKTTFKNVVKLLTNPKIQKAEMIFALGGGSTLDTSKIVADKLNMPIFTFPTLPTAPQATTAMSVVYNDDMTFDKYYYLKKAPEHIFIDLDILKKVDDKYLKQGIIYAIFKDRWLNLQKDNYKKNASTNMANAISSSMIESIFENKYYFENRDEKAFKDIIFSIIVSCGYVKNLMIYENVLNISLFDCLLKDISIDRDMLFYAPLFLSIMISKKIDREDKLNDLFEFYNSIGLDQFIIDDKKILLKDLFNLIDDNLEYKDMDSKLKDLFNL
ncbi:MAG: iron-containing alcohol dehydrogenase [Tissierellia bacterium]|nr:iron-containing alcohol dehydrogenase [Tissierellia bacterium]